MSSKKIAIVTGANKGIGYETVKALLQSDKPYHVFLGSRSLERGKAAVAKLRQEAPNALNTIEAIQLDLSSDASIDRAFKTVKSTYEHIDTLINNAGTQNRLTL